MLVSKNKIYFNPGEDITTEQVQYYGNKEKLETKYYGKDLFVNPTEVIVFRDETREAKQEIMLEPRFTFDKMHYEESRKLMQIKKLLLHKKTSQLKQTYQQFQMYLPHQHYVEVFVPFNISLMEKIPDHYRILDIQKGAKGYFITTYNSETIIAQNYHEFGTFFAKEDQEKIKKLEKRKKL